jgi:hypothetical protein
MKRFGSNPEEMRELRHSDLFFSRLSLLIIMSKAFLDGYPIGKYRKEAIKKNAQMVVKDSAVWEGHLINFSAEDGSEEELDLSFAFQRDRIFHHRVQLLALMALGFAEGCPTGQFRKKALKNTIERVCEAITFHGELKDIQILKVA